MQRPASVTVFGVLNIVFGAFGVLGLFGTAAAVFMQFDQPGQPVELTSGAYRAWTIASLVISVFCVIALFISGIGLLRMRRWGRSLAVAYSTVTVVTTLIGVVIHWLLVAQPMLARFAGDDSPEAMQGKVTAVAGLVGGLIGLAYPVLLWFFMTRPRVLAAFGLLQTGESQPFDAAAVPRNDPANPYSAPTTAEQPVWNPEAGDSSSIAETFIPSKNGPALASYYLGIFSLFPCLGFPLGVAAVYFGIQGIRRVRKTPEVRGGVHAWVGTICGALFGLFNLLLIALIVIGLIANAAS